MRSASRWPRSSKPKASACAVPATASSSATAFEFRLRHDAAEILRSLGKSARPETSGERILLRVFCHAHGARIVLLLGGYDKSADPSGKRQQREIATARQRLVEYRRRV